jgi:hypothetical protein
MTKLLDKSGKLVDIPASDVASAVDSGQFSFPSNRNIPIVQGGTAKWVDPNFAADYYKRLTFTDDDVVATQRAENRTRGVGGLAAATAYGAVKSATLGLAPLLAGGVSDTARDYFRDLELGRPVPTGVGEVAGLFVDPFAIGGKGAARAAEGGAAMSAGDEAGAAGRLLPPGPAPVAPPAPAPPRLGGMMASAPREGAAFERAAAPVAREPAALPAAPAQAAAASAAPAEPLTLGAAKRPYRKPGLTRIAEEAPEAAAVREDLGIVEKPVPEPMIAQLPPGPAPEVPPGPSLRLGGGVGTGEAQLARGRAMRGAEPAAEVAAVDRGLQLPPGGREPVVTPTEFAAKPVDLSGFAPSATAPMPSAKDEIMLGLREAGELAPFETEAVSAASELPYRMDVASVGEEINRVLPEGVSAAQYAEQLGKSAADISQTIKNSIWGGGYRPVKVAPMRYEASTTTGAPLRATSELRVTMQMNDPHRLGRSLEKLQEIEGAEDVMEAGLARDVRFLQNPQKFEVRWNPPAGGKTTLRPSKTGEYWIGAVRDADGNTFDVAKGTRDKVERALRSSVEQYTAKLANDVVQRVDQQVETLMSLANRRLAQEEGRAAQLSFADLPAVKVAEPVPPTAMTGRLEFGRSPAAVAAEREAAVSGVREARLTREGEALAAARAAEREAVMRGGLAPERIAEPVGGPLALRPGVRMEDVIAAQDAAAAEGLRLGRQAPPPEPAVPLLGPRPVYNMPGRAAPQLGGAPLPSGEANTALRDALLAQREAAGTRALPPRRPTAEDLQARALQDVMAARDMQATNQLRAAVEAERASGVPAERALVLAGPEAGAGRYAGGPAAPELLGPMALGRAPAAPEAAAAELAGQVALGQPAAASAGAGIELGTPQVVPQGLGMAAQGAVYSGASQAQRQQMGLEEGGPAQIALAAALGGALPLGLTALGKGFGAASGQVGASLGSNGLPLGQKFIKAMERLEETQLLRTFGLNKGQIKALIGQLKNDDMGRRGTRQFADFVKAEFARLEQLKVDPRFVDNEALQSIKTDGWLKFSNLRPEQRVAFSDAVRTFYGQLVEKVYEPAAGVRIANDELKAALNAIRSKAMGDVKGLGGIPMKSIQSEFDAFSRFVADEENTHTVASLREFEKTLSDSFRQSVGANNEFTPAQRAFRDTIKDLYVSKLDQAVPGASAALREANAAYSIANKMLEGARDLEAKLAQTSPLGRDQLSQFILGAAALNSPIAAGKFLIMGAALRGFYNQRGEGALADMASKLAGNGVRVMQDPVKAGTVAAQSIINANRAVLYPLNAQRFVSVEPGEYKELANSVRDMARNRKDIAKQVMAATAGMAPDKQQQVLQKFDRVFQALGDNLPDNIEQSGKVSEQARQYTVFARSLLDEAYATQVIANGGPDMRTAVEALRAQGEDGQKYIDTLEEQLRTGINNSREAQRNTDLLAAYRNIKSVSKKAGLSIGGGRTGGIGHIVHGQKLRMPGVGGETVSMSPTQVGSAVNAFSGIGGQKN